MSYVLYFTESPETQSPPIKLEAPKSTYGIIIQKQSMD